MSSFLSSSGGAGPLACPRGSNAGPENKLHFKQEACFLKGIIINFFTAYIPRISDTKHSEKYNHIRIKGYEYQKLNDK